MTAVEVDRILTPLDGSQSSLDAAEYAVAVADRYGASVHALYVLDEAVAKRLAAGDVASDAVASEAVAFMDAVEERAADREVALDHSTALGFAPSRLTHHPGSVILDTAEQISADFLVVPREPVSGDPDAVLGKAAQYVLAHASQPVLSV
jgi:nucleotide-binding universal stress UspA family protein